MAYFDSIPLVAGGADPWSSLAGQRQYWDRRNLGVQEGNLARAAQAEQAQNSYFANLANMEAREVAREEERQAQAAAIAREQARQAVTDTESARRFDIGTGLSKEQIGTERERYQFNRDEKNAAERKSLDAIENFAKAKADDVSEAVSALTDAAKRREAALADLTTKASEVQKDLPPGRFALDRSGYLAPANRGLPASGDEAVKLNAANEKLAQARAAYYDADAEHKTEAQRMAELQKEVGQYQLTIVGGRIYSPHHGQWFGREVKKAGENPPPPDGEAVSGLTERPWNISLTSPESTFTATPGEGFPKTRTDSYFSSLAAPEPTVRTAASPAPSVIWSGQMGGGGYALPTPAPAPDSIPLVPADPNQRQAGTIYQTPKGPMRWTGKAWIEP